MIDCKITENYIKEKARMYKDGRTRGCACSASSIPPTTAKLIADVQAWSDAHPPRTYLMDLLEKYPDVKLQAPGTPPICVLELGYVLECPTGINCFYCWNRPMEDTP